MPGYHLRESEDPEVTLCPDSYCPMRSLDLRLSIIYEAQHDGHGWTKESCDKADEELIVKITEDIKTKVEEFVIKHKPHRCHYFGD